MSDEHQSSVKFGMTEAEIANEALRRDEAIAADIRERFGGDLSGVSRGLEAVSLARERLRITDDEAFELDRWMGEGNAAEYAARAGEALATIDPETTPAEARERIRELRTDRGFFELLERGDRRAHKLWDGLNLVAARG